MKRIKAINGYTIYQATTRRDTDKYGINVGEYAVYFSSDIKDYGIAYSYPEFDGIETIEEAENLCAGNYAIAREIVESTTTAASHEEITAIQSRLDAGETPSEIEECSLISDSTEILIIPAWDDDEEDDEDDRHALWDYYYNRVLPRENHM